MYWRQTTFPRRSCTRSARGWPSTWSSWWRSHARPRCSIPAGDGKPVDNGIISPDHHVVRVIAVITGRTNFAAQYGNVLLPVPLLKRRLGTPKAAVERHAGLQLEGNCPVVGIRGLIGSLSHPYLPTPCLGIIQPFLNSPVGSSPGFSITGSGSIIHIHVHHAGRRSRCWSRRWFRTRRRCRLGTTTQNQNRHQYHRYRNQ